MASLLDCKKENTMKQILIPKLSKKQKNMMFIFWWRQYEGLYGASRGCPCVEDTVKAIDMGIVSNDDWEKISKYRVYYQIMNRLDGTSSTVKVSPFSDDFITYFWDKLKPLMDEKQIKELKQFHKKIT